VLIVVSREILVESFRQLRSCGGGARECQVFWIGPAKEPRRITRVVLSGHSSEEFWLEVHSWWLTKFWISLAEQEMSIRVQVHTHAGDAFHSATDDKWPVVAIPGFLSLVIPNFAMGPVGFDGAFLAELGANGFRQVVIKSRLRLV
jgi:hypothetical protein